MSKEIVFMIIGMGIVTFLPRMLPFIMFNGKELPPFIQGILKNVPYATLGALIFPAVFFIQEDLLYGVIGVAAAFIIALLGANVIVVVIGAIAVLSAYSLFF
ncbi:AzlD domain-containing protein [Bacillus sp. B15-48]|uniref:AzlD domain-containing protein n=1 Tax=Bacillus sp. B15-48 TaxID=1548601 RepID=UPI00193FB4A1|nr:AzlD domain-containing protein [Bacillus sp. B15-48]MBM4764186.1 AzlD domain-containing protein [Bacillus sp. B15-48]